MKLSRYECVGICILWRIYIEDEVWFFLWDVNNVVVFIRIMLEGFCNYLIVVMIKIDVYMFYILFVMK